MTTKSKKTYIIYACSFNTGNTIYHEMADTKDNAIMRGIDLSRKNSNNFYYLIYDTLIVYLKKIKCLFQLKRQPNLH